jgi:hypothetical protein
MQTFKEMIYDRFDKGSNDEDQLNPEEVFRHGMASGFSGFIYYNETTEMFDKYGEDIWQIHEDYDAPFPKQENRTLVQWMNAMVWSAVEILAGVYLEEQHQQMEERIKEDAAGGDLHAKKILREV